MSAAPLAGLVRRVTPGPEAVSDAELLDRFTRSADQAAFELLVWRHGAMVWGVCRRMLDPDRDAAEDACQATFLVLARKAARVCWHDVSGWLAAAAHRLAVRARAGRTSSRSCARPGRGTAPGRWPRHWPNSLPLLPARSEFGQRLVR
jgi:DNA-directed RNA polymerase specialized sigma24 family protein